jgi:hypothetical protein
MTVYPQQTNNFSQSQNSTGYDLQSEKQRIAEGIEELKKEFWEEWKIKYANVEIFPPVLSDFNPALVDFLLSFQHTLFYNEIGQKFKLNQEQRNALPSVVWNICKNKNWETLESSLQTNLNLSSQPASQITSLINQKIISQAKASAEKPLASNTQRTAGISGIESRASMILSEALRIHPEVGEQLVTSSKINLRNFPYPVRPSIKNWLADYTFQLGYEKHESMTRSQYLFQGANTKNLPDSEKQKLAYLLKSFDENYPITVNKNTKQIIFPTRNASSASNASRSDANWHSDADRPVVTPVNRSTDETSPSKTSPAQTRPVVPPPSEQKNINSMQFSYRQTLPYEKTIAPPVPIKALPQNFPTSSSEIPAGGRGMERISKSEPSLSQNLPRNVVDLKNINQL